MNTENHFAALAAINVNDKTEKKNGLTYSHGLGLLTSL
jgi:hypothetical protein